jgi:sugar O-acyltransferase (sialic acid O-acetyltransferase NeuD family)
MPAGKTDLCVVLGGGGHASILIESLKASSIGVYAVLDKDSSLWGSDLMGVPILGGDDLLPRLVQEGITRFVVGVGAVRDNRIRRQLFESGVAHGLHPLTVRHPSAICSPWAHIGAGSVLYPAAVVNARAVLGVNVIVNTGAIVEHDCVLGDHVHVATGARLASTVRIGDLAHIGAGATIKQCICVGEGAVVGAGAVVVNDVRPHTVVVGAPARPMKIAENGQKP